jgi:hypothetical protein
MTDEQINATIAEACGWTDIHDSGVWHNHTLWGYPPMKPGQGGTHQYLPNYCNDLNAMHEAEKTLSADNKYVMEVQLKRVLSAREFYFHATACQRAEAFLRTLRKWEEAQDAN